MYEEMKAMIGAQAGTEDETITTKVAAALAVSAIGISLANPSDVVKVLTNCTSCGSSPVTYSKGLVHTMCTMLTLVRDAELWHALNRSGFKLASKQSR